MSLAGVDMCMSVCMPAVLELLAASVSSVSASSAPALNQAAVCQKTSQLAVRLHCSLIHV